MLDNHYCRQNKYLTLTPQEEDFIYERPRGLLPELIMKEMSDYQFVQKLNWYIPGNNHLGKHAYRNEKFRPIVNRIRIERNLFHHDFNLQRDINKIHVVSHVLDRHEKDDHIPMLANVRFPTNIASIWRRPTRYGRIAYGLDLKTFEINMIKTVFPQYSPDLRRESYNSFNAWREEAEIVSYGCPCNWHRQLRM